MIVIEHYQCEYCKKKFSNIENAFKHEDICKKEAALEEFRKNNYANAVAKFYKNFDLDNYLEVINNFLKEMYDDHIDDISLDVKFNLEVSNSHHAPVGKPTNWHNKPELPFGYPGYRGRISGKTYTSKGKYLPDYKNNKYPIPLNTGSGSGSNGHWGYDIFLFIDDFDRLQARAAKLLLNLEN